MVLPYILAVLFCGVFCLIPLAMYLLWLAHVTRRPHPTAISGHWDFVGLMLGLSGFVIMGGGLVLTLFQANFRYWMRGNMEGLRGAWIQERVTWMLLVVCYLVIVLGVSTLTLLARRRSIIVYNVDPASFETTIVEIFEQINRPLEREGKLWASGVPLFELDTFESGHTVTLRWVSNDQRLFEEVTRQLRAALSTHIATENPASRWLLSAAWSFGILAAASCGLLIYGLALLR